MTRLRFLCLAMLCCALLVARATGQTPAASEATQLQNLSKKIDEQNLKIDALSQQILKLQQEVAQERARANPAMVGVPEEAATAATAAATPMPAGTGNSHVVTKGETLTSIAKQYKVGIADLQKINHIEDDRKLQIGQTLAIPGPPGSSPTATP